MNVNKLFLCNKRIAFQIFIRQYSFNLSYFILSLNSIRFNTSYDKFIVIFTEYNLMYNVYYII